MNRTIPAVGLVLVICLSLSRAADPPGLPAVEKSAPGTVPLADVVKEFNAKAAQHRIGKDEPQLTEEEVVAAIRGWDRNQVQASDAVYDAFQRIADTRQLPASAQLDFMTRWSSDKFRFDVWRIDLSILLDERSGFTYSIRDRKLSSSPVPSYEVPQGGVQDLVQFIDRLQKLKSTDDGRTAALRAAAERILELEKDAGSAAYRTALGAKINLLEAPTRTDYEQVKAHVLSKNPRGAIDTGLARFMAEKIARSDTALAIEAYTTFGEHFSGSDDPKAQKWGVKFTGAARRLGLPGKALELTGTTMDGKPFDLANYRGKVVLVDFWATWCGPCVDQFPELKRQYEKYHDRGFEIIGVSLDADREALEKFLKEQQIPWITLHRNDGSGWDDPAAVRYGISSIPTKFLVDRDGKVLDGSLNATLAAQFGPEDKPEKSE